MGMISIWALSPPNPPKGGERDEEPEEGWFGVEGPKRIDGIGWKFDCVSAARAHEPPLNPAA